MIRIDVSDHEASGPVAYMHIPKTSGASVTHALAAAARPSLTVVGYDLCLFGSFHDFQTFDAGLLRQIYFSSADLPRNIELVAGHFAFLTLRAAYPEARMLTVLREPVSRLLSHWLYMRQQTDETLKASGAWGDRMRYGRLSLARFLNESVLASHIDNVAVRMLLWRHPLIPCDDFISSAYDEQLLAEASDRLGEFDFVDIVENEYFASNLRQWLGRQFFEYEKLNETGDIPLEHRAPLHKELTSEAHALLGARTRLDFKLWALVARSRIPGCAVSALRERTILANTAKYAALMATA